MNVCPLSLNVRVVHPNDIRPIIEISGKVGVPIEVMTFLGTSPIRLYAEGWEESLLEDRCRTAVRMAKEAGLPCTFVTEDTVRSQPPPYGGSFQRRSKKALMDCVCAIQWATRVRMACST